MRLLHNKLFQWLTILVSLVAVVNLSRSILGMWQKKSIIFQKQQELEKAKKLNQELKSKLNEADSPVFIEKVAREQLGMVKEGETIVIVPNDKLPVTNGENPQRLPNWQQWWRLFF